MAAAAAAAAAATAAAAVTTAGATVAAAAAPKLGWLGLGIMGRPMVQNLVKGGHTVNVWNRTAAKAQDLKTALPPGTINVCVRWRALEVFG